MPLKIKFFMWYLFKGVVLTKDNLARRQWRGSRQYCFCNLSESIQHLFFDCPLAKFIWRAIQVSFGISPPSGAQHMLSTWLRGVPKKLKLLILVGASSICWAIWLSRNDLVFDKGVVPSYMQVIFRGTHWIRFWSLLQQEEDRTVMKTSCRMLETMVMEIFAVNGWMVFYK